MENTPVPTDIGEIDLWELWNTIWSGRWLVAMIVSVSTMGGIAYAVLAQEWYKAEAVLAPVNQQSSAVGALAGLGGLASLAGISLPSTGDPQPIAVLKSRDFAKDFIVDFKLMPDLLVDERTGSKPLDIRDAVRVFDERVRDVTENTKTRIVTLSIRWKDADTAALWANTLVKRLNDRLREQAVAEAERNVAYLRKEMAATTVVSLQSSIGSMLESQMQKLMLARGSEEYALKVIDQAVAPKKLDAPKRVLVILVSFMSATVLSVVVVLMRNAIWRRSRKL